MFSQILQVMRPTHYIKNLLVLAPIFFANQALDFERLTQSILAFIAFCFCASAVYIFNDYCDQAEDKLHPNKQQRPLAKQSIPTHVALSLMLGLAVCSLILGFSLSVKAGLVLCCYFVLNINYSLWAKRVIALDVGLIALGFVLRLFMGAYATQIPLSPWIISVTFSAALFLALAKRRQELLIYQHTGLKTRASLTRYQEKSLNITIIMSALTTLTLYGVYTQVSINAPSPPLYLSSIFVAAGLAHYLKITFIQNNSGSPTDILLRDRILQSLVGLWLLCFSWILYIT